MKKIFRIILSRFFFGVGICIFIVPGASANESVTKVGNGDDGADLEALTPIVSGRLWESRTRAIKLLTKLSVVGVPGLGLLIPEIERTELLMAAKDVHPTGEQLGSLEISDNNDLVYARTFAEPYAATRFFPAAKKLTPEQMVALHIHEALHRALPEDIRTDENIVMHFTMAMTSPGANYDRIRQVAEIYTTPTNNMIADEKKSLIVTPMPTVTLPLASRTTVGYRYESYSHQGDYSLGSSADPYHRIELNKSLGYKLFFGIPVEPVFRARLMTGGSFQLKSMMGQSSFDLEARFQADEFAVAGPFVRFTTKSIDETNSPNDRDLTTIGGFYRINSDDWTLDSTFAYSLSSSSHRDEVTTKFQPIVSLTAHSGYKFNSGIVLGVLGEVHSTEGSETQINDYYQGSRVSLTKAFRIVFAGPELGFDSKIFQMRLYWKRMINNTNASMSDLGDTMDHGYGQGSVGTSLTFSL